MVACLGWLAGSLAGCKGESVPPLLTRQAPAPAEEEPEPPSGPNYGAPCQRDAECRAPERGQCLSAVDQVAAIQGLVDLWLDFLPSDPDADSDGGVLTDLTEEAALPTPGGYCSSVCTDDEDCGPQGVCLSTEATLRRRGQLTDASTLAGGFVSGPGLCLRPCDRDTDCRRSEGYVCRSALQNVLLIDGESVLPVEPPFFCLPAAEPR